MQSQLTSVVSAPRRFDQGVDPKLVFKIRAVSRPVDTAFEGRGLQLLGETVDYTYFVMADDQGSALNRAIVNYTRTGDLRSFFGLIDNIESYGPEDRIGTGVAEFSRPLAGNTTVDIVVWPASTFDEAQSRVRTVEAVLARSGGVIQLRSVTARRTYLRVQVNDSGLSDLLATSVVETVRTPPVPFLDFRDWRDLAADQLSRVEEPSEAVGVLDDAPGEAHPLLDGLVTSVDSLAPAGYLWQQQGDHGTEVVGRVLFPELHENLRDVTDIVARGTVRVVRILEPDPARPDSPPRFATYALPHVLIEQAIRHLHATHGVKVFNLSAGYAEPYNDLHVGPLTETLDDLVRELGVVIVVPSGNVPISITARTPSGHHIIDDKHGYFFTPEHRMSEPGPAALAVTVGSIALSGSPAEMPGRIGWRAASEAGEVSAFSRSGPGLGSARARMNKPDFVDHGGNVVVNDSGNAVRNDPGASLVSTSFRLGDQRMFASVNGTSFAAPAVARVAADIANEYPDASGNLIRALLASSASRPGRASSIAEPANRGRLYGLGRPASNLATESGARRVTMTYDGSLPVDTVQIHPLPVPELFRRGSGGERSIAVALAFDPPVRRQRREYLAGSMKVDIYRDIDPDDLIEVLRKQDPDDPNDMISGRRRLNLEPGSNSFTNSTLHRRSWTARNSFVNDDETFFVVVTHKAQVWARDDPKYIQQNYALAVTLEDQNLVQADLHQLLTQQVRIPARVRVRA